MIQSDSTARSRLRSPKRPILSHVVEGAIVLFGYFTVAVVATWPLARNPLGGFYGFPNDNYGGIWLTGFLHDAYHGGGSSTFASGLQAPFGLEISQQGLQPLDRVIAYLFGGPGAGLGAYNLQIFAGFVLAGCTMYLLARYVTGNRWASAIAGLIFAFSPFHLAQAMQYQSLSSIQWIPLYILALIVLLRHGRLRDALITGGAFALVATTSYYHAWFMAWTTLAVLLVFILSRVRAERRKAGGIRPATLRRFAARLATRGTLAVGTAVAITLPLARSSAATLGQPGIGTRPIEEAVRYSARPWMLFLPPHDNPILGRFTRGFVPHHLFDAPVYEQSLYIGYTVLFLVAVALWRPLRRLDSGGGTAFVRPLAIGGAVMGLLIIMGPYVPLDGDYYRLWSRPSDTLHVPSLGSLMFEVASIFRFFSRGFVVLSAFLAVLAAIGLARLHRWIGDRRMCAVVTAAVALLIAAEFANSPPHRFAREVEPAWVAAVRAFPANASIVDYPLATENSPRSLYYLYWYRKHRHPTVNPPHRPEALAFQEQIALPDDPTTGKVLAASGIDYAVIHTDLPPTTTPPYQPAVASDAMPTESGSLNPWFDRVRVIDGAVIYKVRTSARNAVFASPTFGAGWSSPEPRPAGQGRWLQDRQGLITIIVAGPARHLRLELKAASFAQPRRVMWRLDNRPAGVFAASAAAPGLVSLDLGEVAPGNHSVSLTPAPQGDRIDAILDNGDQRIVSLDVTGPLQIVDVQP